MPQLKCTVQTCVHNKQFLCDLDEITVGGESAKNPKETCCDSFQERKEGSYTNSSSPVTVVFSLPKRKASPRCPASSWIT